MKKLALFFVACMCLFGCEDPKVQNFGQNPVFSEKSDTEVTIEIFINDEDIDDDDDDDADDDVDDGDMI